MTTARTSLSLTTGVAKLMLTDHCINYGRALQLSLIASAMTSMLISLNSVRCIQATISTWCNASTCDSPMVISQLMKFCRTVKSTMTIRTRSLRPSTDGSKILAADFFAGKSHTVLKSRREKIGTALKPASAHRTLLRRI